MTVCCKIADGSGPDVLALLVMHPANFVRLFDAIEWEPSSSLNCRLRRGEDKVAPGVVGLSHVLFP